MDDSILLDNVHKSFGTVKALNGATLTVESGAVVGFLGLNGAGKTTAIRVLAGLLRPDRGVAAILGRESWTLPAETRRRIGYLSERGFPYDMHLGEAASFVSKFHPTWDLPYFLSLVGLLKVPLDIAYPRLSKGHQRKFQLAITLAPRPEILLLDDPALGLDVAVRREFIESILPLLEEQKSTVLFSSHIFSDVERIADSIAILHEGRVRLHERLDDLKEKARQIVVSGAEPPALAGTLRRVTRGRETRITALDFDPREIDALRKAGAAVDVNPIPLEDFFLDLVAESNKSGAAA
jgi:ABC-2 type transport system ATP-binding protein